MQELRAAYELLYCRESLTELVRILSEKITWPRRNHKDRFKYQTVDTEGPAHVIFSRAALIQFKYESTVLLMAPNQ